MSRKYKFRDRDALYFVTFTVIHWLDVFIRRQYRDIFLDSVRFCQKNKGLEVYAYCIMSSHVHMIIGRHGNAEIQDIVRDLKKYTSVKITEAIRHNNRESRRALLMWQFARAGKRNPNNTNYQFWQQHCHPLMLTSNAQADRFLQYIHNHPVKAGIVLSPEEYLYSSAANYAGRKETLLDVLFIE